MYARLTTFSGMPADDVRAMGAEIERRSADGPPDGVNSTGLTVLTDAEGGRVMILGLFPSEEDREKADAILDAMEAPPGGEGRRVSVEMLDVAVERRR